MEVLLILCSLHFKTIFIGVKVKKNMFFQVRILHSSYMFLLPVFGKNSITDTYSCFCAMWV